MTPCQQVRNVLSVTNHFSGSFMQWIKYVDQRFFTPRKKQHFSYFELQMVKKKIIRKHWNLQLTQKQNPIGRFSLATIWRLLRPINFNGTLLMTFNRNSSGDAQQTCEENFRSKKLMKNYDLQLWYRTVVSQLSLQLSILTGRFGPNFFVPVGEMRYSDSNHCRMLKFLTISDTSVIMVHDISVLRRLTQGGEGHLKVK